MAEPGHAQWCCQGPDVCKGMRLRTTAALTARLLLLLSVAVSARLASCLQDLGQPGCQSVLHNDH
jgi:hypothetical protein